MPTPETQCGALCREGGDVTVARCFRELELSLSRCHDEIMKLEGDLKELRRKRTLLEGHMDEDERDK